jgi:precorrin-3B C17-methyltransferase
VVVGYRTYLDQVKPLLAGQKIESSGMTREIERAERAMELALAGETVALVSGGDPGVYAMAGVAFEVARARGLDLGPASGQLDIQVIPGVPAVTAAAARLGSPLMHDFACVSLSDRLTPWEVIERRLDAAAAADFVIALYNPKSKGRPWQFEAACRIVARHRDPGTPVGVVRGAMRDQESIQITTLADAPRAEVDMATSVIIGNSHTFTYQGRMVTPRGYTEKYDL